MYIIVVDDNPKEREFAQKSLSELGHEITTTSGFDNLMETLFGPDARSKTWDGANREDMLCKVDMILTDTFMDAPEKHVTHHDYGSSALEEIVVGPINVLLALRLQIPYVGLLTSKHHHEHPIPAMYDCLGGDVGGTCQIGTSVFYCGSDRYCGGHKPWKEAVEHLLEYKQDK